MSVVTDMIEAPARAFLTQSSEGHATLASPDDKNLIGW